jgi:aspartate kinase
VELAKKYNVKLYIGKSLESDKRKGTYVMNDSIYIEEMPVTGISISDDCAIYSLRGLENDGVAIAKLFQLLADLHINVDMISKQTYGDDEQAKDLDKAIENHKILSEIAVEKQPGLSILSLVGVGMATATGVASKVFSILAKEGIIYYQITTSEISISVTVNRDEKIKAVIALCEAFGL